MKSLLLSIALTSVAACSTTTSPSTVEPTVFEVVEASGAPVQGIQVCSATDCSMTNSDGEASLSLPYGVQALVRFQHGDLIEGELFTPNGARFQVTLRWTVVQ